MYERFFGLSGLPFSLLPDAAFLYPSRKHRRTLNLLDYGLLTQAGFVVVTGEVGSGKTTLVRRLIKTAGNDVTLGLVTNPSPGAGPLLRWVAYAFSTEPPEGDEAALYHAFVAFLVKLYAAGRRAVLIVDEAQNLSIAQLEELRMLSNVNNENDQLLQVILVGQPELLETLRRPELRQFLQRVTVHGHLDPLSSDETQRYIHHRLGVVGGDPELFPAATCRAVYRATGGVPRLINLLCDQAMVYAFSEECAPITPAIVADVVYDRAATGLSPFRDA
jgi:type II secretory pathway predicted ATPase ExeA